MLINSSYVRAGIVLVISFVLLSTVVPLAGPVANDDSEKMTAYDRHVASQEVRKEMKEQRVPLANIDEGTFRVRTLSNSV
jgi:hypothetical protein